MAKIMSEKTDKTYQPPLSLLKRFPDLTHDQSQNIRHAFSGSMMMLNI